MQPRNAGLTKKERQDRRKKILRAYREDQKAIMWNKVADEVRFCDLVTQDAECCSFDFPERYADPEFEDLDEDYPNKIETLHNIYDFD